MTGGARSIVHYYRGQRYVAAYVARQTYDLKVGEQTAIICRHPVYETLWTYQLPEEVNWYEIPKERRLVNARVAIEAAIDEVLDLEPL
jgi:hypothetical protein